MTKLRVLVALTVVGCAGLVGLVPVAASQGTGSPTATTPEQLIQQCEAAASNSGPSIPRSGNSTRSHGGTVTQRRRFSMPSATASPTFDTGCVVLKGPGSLSRKPDMAGWPSAPATMSVAIHEK